MVFMCLISVVIPLYNKEKLIARAIASIYEQTSGVNEIIVVNDGSTDKSREIVCEQFPEVILIDQYNQGVSSARNTGIHYAKSEFIAFLDADDYWLPNFISNIKELIRISPNSILFCTNYAFITPKKIIPAKLKNTPKRPNELKNYFDSCIKADLPVTASTVCIKKSALLSISCFPVGVKMGEDQIVWSRLACTGKIMFHPQISAYYDLSVENSACDINKIFEPAPQLTIYETLLKENKVPPTHIKSLKKLMHFTVLSCVKNNIFNGKLVSARQILLNNKNLIWDKYRVIALLITYLPSSLVIRLVSSNKR